MKLPGIELRDITSSVHSSDPYSSDTISSQSSEFENFIPEGFSHVPTINACYGKETFTNSQLTVAETLALLFSWFASFPGISKEAFGHLLFLLHSFMLPKNNNLPSSYYEAHCIIKRNLTEVQEYNCCPNDCILYTKEYKPVRNVVVADISQTPRKLVKY